MQLDPRVRVDTILRDEIGIAGAYQIAMQIGCDAVIELHFNAFDGKTSGTLTLCTIDDNDVAFAQIVHKKLCEAFKRDGQSLGVRCVSRVDRGAENLHSFPEGVNCLVEPFFGDEMKDALLGASSVEAYAQALVEAVVLWAKQVDLL
jgi:N-acetylmuramoyl-L-alanine amidase